MKWTLQENLLTCKKTLAHMVNNTTSCHRFSVDNASDNQLFMTPQRKSWSWCSCYVSRHHGRAQHRIQNAEQSLCMSDTGHHTDVCPVLILRVLLEEQKSNYSNAINKALQTSNTLLKKLRCGRIDTFRS